MASSWCHTACNSPDIEENPAAAQNHTSWTCSIKIRRSILRAWLRTRRRVAITREWHLMDCALTSLQFRAYTNRPTDIYHSLAIRGLTDVVLSFRPNASQWLDTRHWTLFDKTTALTANKRISRCSQYRLEQQSKKNTAKRRLGLKQHDGNRQRPIS